MEDYYTVVVHKFSVGDVADPEIYAADPIYKWEKSEVGQWVMQNAVETPVFIKSKNFEYYSQEFVIMAKLSPEKYTYWKLKYE